MAKLKQVIYHTKTDEDRRVYHTNDQCTEGAAITEENTVWRDQCEVQPGIGKTPPAARNRTPVGKTGEPR